MGSIEEIVYKACDLGIREELFSKVNLLKFSSEYKYEDLIKIYEEAFNELLKLKEV